MFLFFAGQAIGLPRFPRIRGDVPAATDEHSQVVTFSPHTRGCSSCRTRVSNGQSVFPAYAGMFLAPWNAGITPCRFPRIRGDVPASLISSSLAFLFSPHTRGCSASSSGYWWHLEVFPAYAGMFLRLGSGTVCRTSFPRIRGDVPQAHSRCTQACAFSPHTRGCSWLDSFGEERGAVFPAYAGMFPHLVGQDGGNCGFPRIRGDVPPTSRPPWAICSFSPHTRGCSDLKKKTLYAAVVFPAYAGMFRSSLSDTELRKCFPRIRGDVPPTTLLYSPTTEFSPHTRGCSADLHQLGEYELVFPAYAGMFRFHSRAFLP